MSDLKPAERRWSVDTQLAAMALVRSAARKVLDGKPMNQSMSSMIVVGLLARACRTMEAIELLGPKLYASEVMALGRIVCESYLLLAWVLWRDRVPRSAEEQEKCARLIADAGTMKALDTARYATNWGGGLSDDQAKTIETSREEISNHHGKIPKLPLVEQLAREAGLWAEYDRRFRVMCTDAHPTIPSLSAAIQLAYLAVKEEEQRMETALALFMANGCALDLLYVSSQILQLPSFDSDRSKLAEAMGAELTPVPKNQPPGPRAGPG